MSALSGQPAGHHGQLTHEPVARRRLAGGPRVDRRVAGYARGEREQQRQGLSVPYGFAFTLSSRVISYTTIHTSLRKVRAGSRAGGLRAPTIGVGRRLARPWRSTPDVPPDRASARLPPDGPGHNPTPRGGQMARARRPEGITEDEHRVLHGELEEAGAVGGAVGGGRGGAGAGSADSVVAARAPGSRPGSSAMTSRPGPAGARPPAPCSTGPSGRSAR